MNFCCHDDYTNTGSFDINDINIYSAYQSWVFQERPTVSEDDLDKSELVQFKNCLLYTSPSPRDVEESRMPSSA